MSSGTSLTERIQSFMKGDAGTADPLMEEVLPKLREIAMLQLRKERYFAPVTRTELINELWVRNLSKRGWAIQDQGHFYALASRAMRLVLVDLARRRLTLRRGGMDASMVSLEDVGALIGTQGAEAQLVEIDVLMEKLEAKHPDAARVFEMRYFAGFELEEIARKTGLTEKQVRVRYGRAVDWLKRNLRTKAGK
jgi:RNA polymerase sigma factor (TIGR02999 family)